MMMTMTMSMNQRPCRYLYDPFVPQKQAGLVSSVASAENVVGKINKLVSSSVVEDDDDTELLSDGIRLATSIALWGNKMDLSIWPADISSATKDMFSSIFEQAQEGLLTDDSNKLVEHCLRLKQRNGNKKHTGSVNIHIIVDNAGFELITDLLLGQYFLESGIASTVTFQCKSHPTFVSDALEKDVLEHIQYYADLENEDTFSSSDNNNKYPNCIESGKKWQQYMEEGKFRCQEDNFWNQGYPMWKMTEPIRSTLYNNCELAVVKGDANYRRL